MAAAALIFLREGVEGSMIVAILLAYLSRIGRRDLFRDIFTGVALALVLAGSVGVVVYLTVHTYSGTRGQTLFETATYLLATAVLTYMTLWMHSHARTMARDLKQRVDAAVAVDRRARFGLGLLAFQAVGREGLETVVFTLAIAFSASAVAVLAGGSLGLLGALVISYFVYRLGHRINIGVFFQVLGTLLMVFAAGLLVDAVENLQQIGWLPVLTRSVWNTGSVLSEQGALGDILHTFFGYASAPSQLQVIVYVLYVASVLFLFFGVGARLRSRHAPSPPR